MRLRARVTLVALVLAGCAQVQVNTDWNPQADFSKLHRWAWFPEARPTSGDPRLDSGLIDVRVRDAVESELGARGFARGEPVDADFLVAYHVALEKGLRATTIDDYYGGVGYHPWRGGYSETFVTELEIGTLLLDVLDPRNQELLWRGTARAEIIPEATPEQREARIRDAVRRMLERFPPTP